MSNNIGGLLSMAKGSTVNFDERSQTAISKDIESFMKNERNAESLFNYSYMDSNSEESLILWKDAKGITNTINRPEMKDAYGTAEELRVCNVYLALGTKKGYVLLFNFHQELDKILLPSHGHSSDGGDTSITSLCFSSDCTRLAAGYANGVITIWNLAKTKDSHRKIDPFYTIHPLSSKESALDVPRKHHVGIPISFISFIGTLSSQIVSADRSGLVFYHYALKTFLRNYFLSQFVLGKLALNQKKDEGTPHKYEFLPLGTSSEITDAVGVFAILTPHVLEIISVLSLEDPANMRIVLLFKTKRPSSIGESPTPCISLSWYPCMINGNKKSNARLAYCWNNCLTVLEVCNDLMPSNYLTLISKARDKDKAFNGLPFKKTFRYYLPEDGTVITDVKWISEEILFLFTSSRSNDRAKSQVVYYDSEGKAGSLARIASEPLSSILSQNLNTVRHGELADPETCESNSDNFSIVAYKGNIFLQYKEKEARSIFNGKKVNWAYLIIQLLMLHRYLDAVHYIFDYYNSDDYAKLALISLEFDKTKRHSLLVPSIFKIMQESLISVFNSDEQTIEIRLRLYLDVLSRIYMDNSKYSHDISLLIEAIFESIQNQSIFFRVLEPYLIWRRIATPSPVVLKSLVEHYTSAEDGHKLTEILCQLDIRFLDIDFTVHLCEQFRLKDCLIYITNYLLHDYKSPMYEFLKEITDANSLQPEESDKVYTYISYILTGRQYPVDRYIEHDDMKYSRNSILEILFGNELLDKVCDAKSISNIQTDALFPYLHLLLKNNSFRMLSALNEFFEDSSLNDDSSGNLTRQYIIDALLDIYELQAKDFSDYDRTQLSIFIARNYAKYPQFIRLSDTTLNNIIDTLCFRVDPELKEECELALQSFLSIYDPVDYEGLVEKLRSSKYYDALMYIYQSRGEYSRILQVLLEIKGSKDESMELHTYSLQRILEGAFIYSGNKIERLKLISLIKNHFHEIADMDLDAFISLISKYSPLLHSELVKIDDASFICRYLERASVDEKLNQHTLNLSADIIKVYVKSLCTINPKLVLGVFEKYYSVLRNDSAAYSDVKQILRENGLRDCLFYLLMKENKFLDALNQVLEELSIIADRLNLEANEEDFENFDHYFHLASDCCQNEETYHQLVEGQLLNEKMWLSLIKKCVTYSNRCAQALAGDNSNSEKLSSFYDRYVQKAFKRISELNLLPNSSNKNAREQSFINIFNKFLEETDDASKGSSVALLSNVKEILEELFISYSYESEMLELSMKKLNKNLFQTLNLLTEENNKGWDISNALCSSCGKHLCGSEVPEYNYTAWEYRKKHFVLLLSSHYSNSAPMGNIDMPEIFANCRLIIFKCSHSYHSQCLSQLGIKEAFSCVLCSDTEVPDRRDAKEQNNLMIK